MAIKINTTMKIKLPKLDMTRVLEDVAEKIIILDIRLGINRGVGIDNRPFPPLEPSTIARKSGARANAKKSGGLKLSGIAGGRGGSQTLVDTGALRESFESVTIKQNHVRIIISGDRRKIASYLQLDGVGKKKKRFNFFGISQRAELQAISKMDIELKKALEDVNNG